MPELVVAANHLEACQTWQEIINAQTTGAAKDEAGQVAIKTLKRQTYLGTRKVILSAEAAMFFQDGINTAEEAIRPEMQFGETIAQGWLGRLSYKRIKQERFITWTLYDPKVLGPTQEEEVVHDEQSELAYEPAYRLPIEQTLRRPLHFPVGLINYALCYDR